MFVACVYWECAQLVGIPKISTFAIWLRSRKTYPVDVVLVHVVDVALLRQQRLLLVCRLHLLTALPEDSDLRLLLDLACAEGFDEAVSACHLALILGAHLCDPHKNRGNENWDHQHADNPQEQRDQETTALVAALCVGGVVMGEVFF